MYFEIVKHAVLINPYVTFGRFLETDNSFRKFVLLGAQLQIQLFSFKAVIGANQKLHSKNDPSFLYFSLSKK